MLMMAVVNFNISSVIPIPFRRINYEPKTFLRMLSLPSLHISFLTVDHQTKPPKSKPIRFVVNYEAGHKLRIQNGELSRSSKILTRNIGAISPVKEKDKLVDIMEKENIWTVPNILCCARIFSSPYLGYLICHGDFNMAFVLLLFAGLTDMLDGWIARRFISQASKLGTFLDPIADKILISTLCITLSCADLMPGMLTILILARDIVLASAGFYIRYKSLPHPKTMSRYFDATHATAKLAPTATSKFNTAVQLVAVGVGVMSPVFGFAGHPGLHYLWFFTASTTLASAISYVISKNTYKILKKV